jgi:hypothetical protein
MTYADWVGLAANWSAILTAVIAVGASVLYWSDCWKKRRKLESYLKKEKENGQDQGQRSLIHLTRSLAMTEGDILHAAFRSNYIEARAKVNKDTGFCEELLLAHK